MAANLPYTRELQTLYRQLQGLREMIRPVNGEHLFSSIEQTTGLDFVSNYFMKTVFCDEKKVAANINSIKEDLDKIIAAVATMGASETLGKDYSKAYNTLKHSTESLVNGLNVITTELDGANLKQTKEALAPIANSIEKTISVAIPALLYAIAQECMGPNRSLKEGIPIVEETRMSFIFEFNQVFNENPRYEQAYTLHQQALAVANQAVFNP